MTFATDLATLPYEARQQDATGFLPPIARATGHLLFVLEHIAATAPDTQTELTTEPRIALADTDLLDELNHAKEHWDAVNHNQALSPPAVDMLQAFGTTLASALTEFENWTPETRINNLRDLCNRVPGILAKLDRELVGLRDSDPGWAL